MCGQGEIPTWMMVLMAPIILPGVVAAATKEAATSAVEKTSQNSIHLFEKINPSALHKKISNISQKMSLVSVTKVYGSYNAYKMSQYYYKRAVYQLLLRNFADAQKDLMESTTHYDANFKARFLLGSVYFMLGVFSGAAEEFRRAVSCYDTFVNNIKKHEGMEKMSETANKLENLGIKARDTFNSLFSSAIISHSGALKKTMKESSAQSQAHLELLDQFEKQQNQMDKAEAYNAIGVCNLNASMDSLEEAAAAFTQAVALCENPAKRAQFGFNLSICLFYARNFQDALSKLNELVLPDTETALKEASADSNNITKVCLKAYKLRGYLNSYYENNEQAASDYARAAELNSSSVEAVKEGLYYRLIPEVITQKIMTYLPVNSLREMLVVSRHINKLASHPSLWPVMTATPVKVELLPPCFDRFSQATTLKLRILPYNHYTACWFIDQFRKNALKQGKIDTIHIINDDYSYCNWISDIVNIPKVRFISFAGNLNPYWVQSLEKAHHDLLQVDFRCKGATTANEIREEVAKLPHLKCLVNVILLD